MSQEDFNKVLSILKVEDFDTCEICFADITSIENIIIKKDSKVIKKYCSKKCSELLDNFNNKYKNNDFKYNYFTKCFYCDKSIIDEIKVKNQPEVFCSTNCKNNYWQSY